jgi:hypothetical protein
LRKRQRRQILQGRAAPEPQRSTQPLGRGLRIAARKRGAALGDELLELLDVDVLRRELEHVSGRPGD